MWGLLWNRGSVSNIGMIFVLIQTKKIWLYLSPWSPDLRAKRYERTPTWIYDRIRQGPRSCESLLESLGLANHEWLGSWMGPHAPHLHPWCILSIGFSACQLIFSPYFHINCVFVGWLGHVECVASALPKFGWRWGCHPNRRPQKILWMATMLGSNPNSIS